MKTFYKNHNEIIKFIGIMIIIGIASFYIDKDFLPVLTLFSFTVGFFFCESLHLIKKIETKLQPKKEVTILVGKIYKISYRNTNNPFDTSKPLLAKVLDIKNNFVYYEANNGMTKIKQSLEIELFRKIIIKN